MRSERNLLNRSQLSVRPFFYPYGQNDCLFHSFRIIQFNSSNSFTLSRAITDLKLRPVLMRSERNLLNRSQLSVRPFFYPYGQNDCLFHSFRIIQFNSSNSFTLSRAITDLKLRPVLMRSERNLLNRSQLSVRPFFYPCGPNDYLFQSFRIIQFNSSNSFNSFFLSP